MKGQQDVMRNLGKLTQLMQTQVSQQVLATAHKVRNSAITGMARDSKTGEVYSRGGNLDTQPHQASAAGQSPAVDTGNLMNSISVRSQGLKAYVFTPVEYGLYLEFGTSRMAARPWLRPALDANLPEFRQAIQQAFNQTAKEIGR